MEDHAADQLDVERSETQHSVRCFPSDLIKTQALGSDLLTRLQYSKSFDKNVIKLSPILKPLFEFLRLLSELQICVSLHFSL